MAGSLRRSRPVARLEQRAARTLTALVLSAATMATTAGSARAAPSASQKDRAGNLMVAGDADAAKGDWKAAFRSYRAADDIMHVPSTRVAVARALDKLGRLLEARRAAAQTAAMPKSAHEPAAFTSARASAARMLVDLDARIPTLAVIPAGVRAGARVHIEIDGTLVPSARFGVASKLDPGTHRITAAARGYRSTVEVVALAEGEHRTLSVTLVLRRREMAPSPAVTPSAPRPAVASPGRRGSAILSYVGFGVGAAGLIAGSVSGLMSIARTRDIVHRCGGSVCPSSYRGQIDSARTLGWASNVSVGVGVVGVGVGLAALLMQRNSVPAESPAAAELRLMLGVRRLGVRGRF